MAYNVVRSCCAWHQGAKDRRCAWQQNCRCSAVRQQFAIAECANVAFPRQIHNLTIKHTSAVTTTVLGEVKIIGLLLLSAWLLGDPRFTCAFFPKSSGDMFTSVIFARSLFWACPLCRRTEGLHRQNGSRDGFVRRGIWNVQVGQQHMAYFLEALLYCCRTPGGQTPSSAPFHAIFSWAKLSSTKAATQPSAISTDSIELQPLQNGETP